MAEPVILRAYNDGHTGATAFFRNRPFLDALFDELGRIARPRYKILAHACSLGAEPYSIALWWLNSANAALRGAATLDVAATDVDSQFLEYAERGDYPETVLAGMTRREQSWFVRRGDSVAVPTKARRLVRFLAPSSFVEADIVEDFDAVLIMNALTYVSPEQQSATIRRWSAHCRLLGVTAFHPDSIRGDIDAIGFEPCDVNHREIHEAWGDRLAQAPVPRDRPDYSWRLPPYETSSPDYRYRYGALFRRAPP